MNSLFSGLEHLNSVKMYSLFHSGNFCLDERKQNANFITIFLPHICLCLSIEINYILFYLQVSKAEKKNMSVGLNGDIHWIDESNQLSDIHIRK